MLDVNVVRARTAAAEHAHAVDRFAREIGAILECDISRSRRLMRNSLDGRPSFTTLATNLYIMYILSHTIQHNYVKLVLAASLLCLAFVGCTTVTLPPEAEQVLYQQVIYDPKVGTGCTLRGGGCSDIRIYNTSTLNLDPDMQLTGILTAWCVHWGGLERNPITGDDVRFAYHTVILHTTQGYSAQYSAELRNRWQCG